LSGYLPRRFQKQKISTVLENVATGTSSATSTALVPRENLPVTTYALGLPNNRSSVGSGAKGNVNLVALEVPVATFSSTVLIFCFCPVLGLLQ
jgi:hypothetical protein